MRLPAVFLCLVLTAAPLFAADWPAGFGRYEQRALEKPTDSDAVWQMWRYAVSTGRVEELKQKWKKQAEVEPARPWHIFLALIAEYENDFTTARAQFDQAISAAPNDPTPILLLGKLQSAYRMPEARATLDAASKLELKSPGAATEALAREYLLQHRPDDARKILDAAVTSAHDAQAWLRFTELRAEAAMAQGHFGELIAQLAAAPPGPFGGSEVAQAWLAAHDDAQASAAIERARKDHPDDALLRQQALNIATAANRPSEIARLLREETKLAPTPAKWRDLFRALVKNGEADEARAILNAQGVGLFSEPLAWRDLVPELWQEELAHPFALTLAKETTDGHWEAALLRAELLIAEKSWEPAQAALWRILDAKANAQPLATEPSPSAPELIRAVALPGGELDDRVIHLNEYLERIPAPFDPKYSIDVDRAYPVRTLTDARDLAVLYLAMIAADTQTAADFTKHLTEVIADWPRSERLVAWTIVQNPAGLLNEMAAYAHESRTPQLDRFCRAQLPAIRRLHLDAAQAERAAALADEFPEPPRLDDQARRASQDFGERFRESNLAFRQGHFDEAAKIFDATAAAFRATGSPTAEREIIACAMSFAFLVPELRGDAAQKAEGAALAVRCAFPSGPTFRWPDRAEGLSTLIPAETPALSYRFFERGTGEPPRADSFSVNEKDQLLYPPSPLFSWDQTGVLWTVFGQTRSPKGGLKSAGSDELWTPLKKRLDTQVTGLQGDAALHARAAVAYLAWWNQEYDDAIARLKQLSADTHDVSVGLGLASMLAQHGDSAAALTAIDEITASAPALAPTVKSWRLRILTRIHDTANATATAQELAKTPWTIADLRTLVPLLESSGCGDAAAALRPRLLEEDLREEDVTAFPSVLHELDTSAMRAQAETLAERILAASPSSRPSWRITQARAAALQIIKNSTQASAYVTRLDQQAQAAPENVAAWQRLAEAQTGDDALKAWRKVFDLQPESRPAAIELLRNAKAKSEEQRQFFETLLSIDPDEAVSLHSDLLFNSYLQAKQIPHLAEAIANAPFRPAGWRAGTQNSSTWRNRVNFFVSQPEAALLVVRKAITTFDPVPSDLRQLLVQQLVALNRHEEAGRELIECLAPDSSPPPALFAWRKPTESSAPKTTIDTALFKMARSLGVTPELRARLQQAAPRDATARAVWAYLRVSDHEPSALADVQSLIPQVKPAAGDISWVLPLATELSTWPDSAETNRQLLLAYDGAMQETKRYLLKDRLAVARLLALIGARDDAVQRARTALDIARNSVNAMETPCVVAEIALRFADDSLFADCTKYFTDLLSRQAGSRNYFGFTEPLRFAGILLDAGRLEEARGLLAGVRALPTLNNNTNLLRRLEALEAESELRQGESRLASPVAWLDLDRSKPDQSTIVWDLGLLNVLVNNQAQPVIRGESFPTLEGHLAVELFAGQDGESMHSLARLDNVGSHGMWQGPVPPDTKDVRVVVTQGDRILFGPACPVAVGQNLLAQDVPSKSLPAAVGGEMKWNKGGPVDGYLSFHADEPRMGVRNVVTSLRRVAVKPGHDYLLSGWWRQEDGFSHLGWRCLDHDGHPLQAGNAQFNSTTPGERFWTRCSQHLGWPAPNGGGSYSRMPLGTVYLEAVVTGEGSFDLAGLSIVELPSSTTPNDSEQ